MHEYRLANVDRSAGKRSNLRLDDWVLCRIYNKKGTMEKHLVNLDHEEVQFSDIEDEKPKVDALAYNDSSMFQTTRIMQTRDDYFVHFDTSESDLPPKFQYTDSSCSNRVVSPEVQSQAKWSGVLDFQINYVDGIQDYYDPFGSQMQCHYNDQIPQFQDSYSF